MGQGNEPIWYADHQRATMGHPRQDGPAGCWPAASGRSGSHSLAAAGGKRPWVIGSY